ncbi:hypothetical protein [Kribbella hippodromi]|uniref:hypothetical protein n=1 Tax=Kribbella hippodromi TaxID=434347 RepID=UPI0031DFF550
MGNQPFDQPPYHEQPQQQPEQQPQYQQGYQGYQQPQFGPGPYTAQFRPPRRRGGLLALGVVLSVVLVLLLVGAGIFLLTPKKQSTSGPVAPSSATAGSTTSASNGPTVPTAGPATTAPTTVVPTSGLVPCVAGHSFQCLPKATLASASAYLKTKGAVCSKDDRNSIKCVKGGKDESIDITLEPVPLDSIGIGRISTFRAMTFSNGAGDNPKGRALVIANLHRSMKSLMAAALPGDAAGAQIIKWLPKDMEQCTGVPATVSGYQVMCAKPTRFSITDHGKTLSSWSASFTLSGVY